MPTAVPVPAHARTNCCREPKGGKDGPGPVSGTCRLGGARGPRPGAALHGEAGMRLRPQIRDHKSLGPPGDTAPTPKSRQRSPKPNLMAWPGPARPGPR